MPLGPGFGRRSSTSRSRSSGWAGRASLLARRANRRWRSRRRPSSAAPTRRSGAPEEFLVAAAASCLAVTFAGLDARDGLTCTGLKVEGDGVVGRRDDGRFGFTRLLLRLELETDPTEEAQARRLAEQAERTFLVSVSLDLPVETVIEVRPRAAS